MSRRSGNHRSAQPKPAPGDLGKVGLGIGVMLLWSTAALAADVNSLRAATVKINVEHSAGVETGSGIILCQSQGRVVVLTAKHVVSARRIATPAPPAPATATSGFVS